MCSHFEHRCLVAAIGGSASIALLQQTAVKVDAPATARHSGDRQLFPKRDVAEVPDRSVVDRTRVDEPRGTTDPSLSLLHIHDGTQRPPG
jgi:hypothetical protein